MTVSTKDFTGLSEAQMTRLALSRGEALKIRAVEEHLPEVLENLLILQGHARTFTAFLADPTAEDPQ